LIPGTTVSTPVVAWSTPPATATSSTVSAVPAEADHTQLPETSTTQIPATSTTLASNLGSASSSLTGPSAVANTVASETPVAAPSQDSQYHGTGDMQPSASASSSMQEESSQPESNASTNVMDTSTQDSQYLSADAGRSSTPAPSSEQDESSQRPNSDASAYSTSTSANPYTAAINTVATPSHPSGSSPPTTVVAYQGEAAAAEISTGLVLMGLLCYALLTQFVPIYFLGYLQHNLVIYE